MPIIDLNSSQDNLPILIGYDSCDINIIDKNTDYIDFFENYVKKNKPCIIKNVAADWESTEKWVLNDTINYDYFISEYGDMEAPVADCNNVAFNAHCKTNMTVSNYMNYLNNKTEKVLYLKDWHLRKLRPMDHFYEVPLLFASDWLNEFAEDEQDDDYMFVYIGPKDSWTPLHADVYSSYSWSVNVVGSKKWVLFPPGQEDRFKDKFGNLPIWFEGKEVPENVKYFEVVQEKGDAIFVPSGWFHQVINLVDTISINHNWINGCNIEKVWHVLHSNLISVQKEIEEFKNTEDFESHCQLMLKSVFGMDFKQFIRFVCYIGKKRLEQLQMQNCVGFGQHIVGIKHIKFDLRIVLKIMQIISNHNLLTNTQVVPIEQQKELFTLKAALMAIILQ